MKKTWVVYVHKSKTTGKYYVGQTCQPLETRWGKNGSKYTKEHNLKFYNAIQKYGWQDFDHFIIAKCETLKQAHELEQFYIGQLDSFKNGYNSTLGGAGSLGKKMTEKTKQKIIATNRGKPSWIKYVPSEKTPMFGRHHSEETKKKIGNANRGRVISQTGREKMRLAKLGKKGGKRTKETKEKLRIQKMGNKNPMYGKHTNNRPDSKVPVIQYDLQGNFIKEYESIRFAERTTGIYQICRSIKNDGTAGGYIWKKKTHSN